MANDAPAPARLPRPAMSFGSCRRNQFDFGTMTLMSLKNDIVAVDWQGCTVLYNGASGALRTMQPVPQCWTERAISVTVGDGLYVLVTEWPASRTPYFQALLYGRPLGYCRPEDWHWRPLQPPSFDLPDDYEYPPPQRAHYGYDHWHPTPNPYEIRACTVVGDSQIWVSTADAGTYSFDTPSGAWSKLGDWTLPFKGRAEYVPEHGLWFGFTDDGEERLCAVDLALTRQPVLQHAWAEGPAPPTDSTRMATRVLPLGSGRLCVARFFRRTKSMKRLPSGYKMEIPEYFAVLAGVEVVKDQDGSTGILQVIKHKAKRYSFGQDHVNPL